MPLAARAAVCPWACPCREEGQRPLPLGKNVGVSVGYEGGSVNRRVRRCVHGHFPVKGGSEAFAIG